MARAELGDSVAARKAPLVRVAHSDDAAEVLRLAYGMWRDFGMEPEAGDWEAAYHTEFVDATGRGDLRVMVVDDPDQPGRLISCGAAWVYRLLPAPWLANGKMGFLQWFYTEPSWRGRGVATAVAEACLVWLDKQGCTRVQLHAAPRAEEVYRRLGFAEGHYRNMWLQLPKAAPPD